MNLFFEGLVPALMQTLSEKEEILILLLEHCVGIVYGLCYESNKGVCSFTSEKLYVKQYFLMSVPPALTALSST